MDLCAKPFGLSLAENEKVRHELASLSLEEKIGQLFCVLGDLYSPETLQAMVQKKGIGGVLFRPAPLAEIQARFAQLDPYAKIPLWKAANLEDGASGALSTGTRYSSELGVAATHSPFYATELALSASYEARQAGINITFSPDADIDFNCFNPITNERTYGSNPSLVARYVKTEIQGFLRNGIVPCVKHFPGDGIDFRDQHLLTTYNSLSYSAWEASYGKVYRRAIKAGVPCFMVGHIACPEVSHHADPSIDFAHALPASLSPELLQGILRGEMGFNGLILSDATIMGGFTQAYERKEALPRMIASGIDQIVFNADFEEDYGYLYSAAKEGRLSLTRIDEAVSRILAAKMLSKRFERIQPINVESNSRRKLVDESITLVKDKGGILPLSHEKYDAVTLIPLGNDSCPEGSLTSLTKARLEKEGYSVTVFDIDSVDMHGPALLPKRTLTLYLANLETASNQTAVRINWAKKHALDSPRYLHETSYVFVSFANPFHLMDVPKVPVYINAYCANRDVVDSVLDKILGKSPFKGVSPVDAYCGLKDTYL